jgi:UDP-N-acetylmuramate-alanine ligase
MDRNEVVAYVQKKKPDVLLTMGAGDIDQMVESLALVMQGLEDDE